MSDAAIKAALEAACRTDGLYGIKPEADADIRRDRAEAIAAFLRAIPAELEIQSNIRHATEFQALAAAVERAASTGEGGDG